MCSSDLVALVCGAGINCVGVAEDGRVVRFASLGRTTGDWGGGEDLGIDALWAAARGVDGRGPETRLIQAVPAHFGLDSPLDVARSIHFGELASVRLSELAPVVLAEASRDPVAGEIVERLKAEIVNQLRATIIRLGLGAEPFDVVLGGGLFRADGKDLVEAVTHRLGELSPQARVKAIGAHPIVGAGLLALDELGSDQASKQDMRRSLGEVIDGIEPLDATPGTAEAGIR